MLLYSYLLERRYYTYNICFMMRGVKTVEDLRNKIIGYSISIFLDILN